MGRKRRKPPSGVPFTLRTSAQRTTPGGTSLSSWLKSGSKTLSGLRWGLQKRLERSHVNNRECAKLEIAEVEECSLGPGYSDVDVRHTMCNATREGRNIFEVFVERKGEHPEHPVKSKLRWDDCQRRREFAKRRKLGRRAKDYEEENKRKSFAAVKTRREKS